MTSYDPGPGSGFTRLKVKVPTVPVPVPQHWKETNPLFCPVVPEDGEDAVEMQDDDNTYIEDQSDVDARKAEIARLAREAALAKRSSAVKRDMPRPTEMNNAVLRPMNSDPPLTELQVRD